MSTDEREHLLTALQLLMLRAELQVTLAEGSVQDDSRLNSQQVPQQIQSLRAITYQESKLLQNILRDPNPAPKIDGLRQALVGAFSEWHEPKEGGRWQCSSFYLYISRWGTLRQSSVFPLYGSGCACLCLKGQGAGWVRQQSRCEFPILLRPGRAVQRVKFVLLHVYLVELVVGDVVDRQLVAIVQQFWRTCTWK
jgi:hypothetical protein